MLRCTLVVYTVLSTFCLMLIHGAEFSECDGESPGNYVPVSSNCSKAFYCDGAQSTIVDCDANSPYFSSVDRTCYNNFTVCGDRPFKLEYITIATTMPPIPTVSATITTQTTTILSSITPPRPPTSPNSSKQTYTTTVPTTQGIITTVPAATTTPKLLQTTSKPKNSSSSKVQCPDADDPGKPLFLPHPKYCSQYYLCYHGAATLLKCPSTLQFDVVHQTCNTAERVKCKLNSVVARDQCLPYTVDVYPHPTNCNYYYLCEYGFLMVMQCPFNMHWDYEGRVCAMKKKAKCYTAYKMN